MEEPATAANIPAATPEVAEDRREAPRLPTDEEAMLLLLARGTRLDGRMNEISLSGCRVKIRERLTFGTATRVEIAFRLRGAAFRFTGEIEWTDGKQQAGVRFVAPNPRRMGELAEVLCEVAAEQAANTMKQTAAEQRAAEETRKHTVCESAGKERVRTENGATPSGTKTGAQKMNPDAAAENGRSAATAAAPVLSIQQPAAASAGLPLSPRLGPLEPRTQTSAVSAAARAAARERRVQNRHPVDTTAIVFLVNVASRIPGRILNLSMGGCRIRTEEKFPVGIYTRVETEFRLEGLPFRLGGVVQAIQDRFHVGIRFLDMSERKQEQLEMLIAEIEEMQAEQASGSTKRDDGQALSA